MSQRRSIEIAFEIARVFVCGDEDWRDCAAWCSECDGYVPMITLKNAAILENTTVAIIFRRIEAGELHHKTTADGKLFACFSSLLDADESLIDTKTVF